MKTKEEVRLMDLSHGAGCGCKMGPGQLNDVLQEFRLKSNDPRVLVGFETGDDAAVIQLNSELAIVQTTDFFTPILNDPYKFGQVAAANALSDIYAMGGTPLSALSLVAFPIEKLGKEILGDILRGGFDKVKEAGIEIVGGHSIDDPEPKFGLAVTGLVHPKKIIKNRGAKKGDLLLLTKPIGTGVLTTSIKKNISSPEIEKIVFQNMARLNLYARNSMVENFEFVHSATDVTGFGLAGHLSGMLRDSNLKAVLQFHKIPILPYTLELLAENCFPGGTNRNMAYLKNNIDLKINPSEHSTALKILCDPQTSGGLLIAVNPIGLNQIQKSLVKHNDMQSEVIGEIQNSDSEILCEIV
ncbi:MAG: selenide, water dikinase SelD [Leptospiraceae bacterium]|nr:selenide, water dikinase SelD [Leptospiraceae bacterium]MCK6381684.1 selenide, water dikinase SelD [Leptospiraceae bacterium]NUM40553.1 selenide, water dikinase SelD [Leptospiraceae bacterium]